MDAETISLKKEIDELKRELELSEKQQILIVGEFDGTNVQVSINGIRRKIATTSP